MSSQKTTAKVLEILANLYPEAECELEFSNPFQLLIATILSAQCTDKRVNEVTRKLFTQVSSAADIVQMGQDNLEAAIREVGLYHNKAKNILATCSILATKYKGQVPADIDTLRSLPGVGRKTANVVASNAFQIPAIAVDTHVFRVANRIGLAKADKVEKVEEQLMQTIPKEQWIKAHHWLIWHGRRVCHARNPNCQQCSIIPYCNYSQAGRIS